MIRGIMQLGKYAESSSKFSGFFEDFDYPFSNSDDAKVIVLSFNIKDFNKAEYEDAILYDYDSEKAELYYYKKGTSRGGNFSPTLKYTGDISRAINNLKSPIDKIKIKEFNLVYNFLMNKENVKKIESDLSELINKKYKYLITLKINNKWMGEFSEVREVMLNQDLQKYYSKYKTISKANDKICYICKKKKKDVFGFVSTYSFYTLDKKGMVSGGFTKENAWKNYPVCSECSRTLEIGKKFVEKKFESNFAGYGYFIIPEFLFENFMDDKGKKYLKILELISDEEKIYLSDSSERDNSLFGNESRILNVLSKENNYININIVFFRKNNSEFKIIENIENVLPSRLNKIFEIKNKVEGKDIYNDIFYKYDKKENYNYKFNFSILEMFLKKFDTKKNSNNLFFETMSAIFLDKKISENLMIKSYIELIREKFLNTEIFKFISNDISKDYIGEVIIKKSLIMHELMCELNLFEKKKGDDCIVNKNEKNYKYLDFFEQHEKVFNKNLKKGVFLLGVLTNKFLNLDEQRENKPFYSRLNSLKMNEKIIKRILVEIVNKLNEYGKGYYYIELRELITEYLLHSEFSELTNDELSYYFVSGMNLGKLFKNNRGDDKYE